MSKSKKQLTKQEAIEALWRSGVLHWKLKGKQIELYNHFKNSTDDISVAMISRRWGKSHIMCTLAVETCSSTPNAIVKYVCPQQKMAERIIYPIIRKIIEDCPEDLKPKWYPSDKVWRFPNGSEIQIAGTDGGNYDNIRGGAANLCIVDEAGFCDELETVVYSVLAPTTDTTGGKIYMASTPNDKNPNHEFHELFVFPLQAVGKLLKYTLHDSPLLTVDQIEKIINRYPGGQSNIKFRCEYLCEIPEITESSIIPEFGPVESEVVMELPKPSRCHFYTSMDVGFHDLTVALFGYYCHDTSRLVVTDEYVINGPEMTTNKLYEEISHKEKVRNVLQSSFDVDDYVEPFLRIMDNDLKLINDLAKAYGMVFIPTQKHNKEQAVDTVRRWVEAKRIIIHPRCVNLIYHLKFAQWKVTRNGTFTGQFKHLKGNEAAGLLPSHADALDALIYLVRNIQTEGLPQPRTVRGKDTFVSPHYKDPDASQASEIMGKILNLKKK